MRRFVRGGGRREEVSYGGEERGKREIGFLTFFFVFLWKND
jgi:hypothetical protein